MIHAIQCLIQMLNEDLHGLIEEGLSFKQTSYGTNIPVFNDRDISSSSEDVLFAKFKSGLGKKYHYTFFKDGDTYVIVFVRLTSSGGYELTFATSSESPGDDLGEFINSFDISRTPSSAFSVFGKVMFIASILAQEKNIKQFSVSSTVNTSSVYDKLKTSKVFIKTLESYGWKIVPFTSGFRVIRT